MASYVLPKTWALNDLVTPAQLNQDLRDNVIALHDSYLAWTSYTPTLTQSATVTKTVTYAKYISFGKTVHCQGYLVVTGAGTAGNAIVVGLPVTALHGGVVRAAGSAIVYDSSVTTFYPGIGVMTSTTTMNLLPATVPATNYLGVAEFTAALAVGDQISWSITYEAA